MSHSIFNKRAAKDKGKTPESRLSGSSAPRVKKIAPQSEQAFHLDITVDEAMRALDSELSGLARLEVAQAAKERGWATLRRELERRPIRTTVPALQKGIVPGVPIQSTTSRPVLAGHSRGWRIVLGSAVAAVAVMAVLLGTYGAGLLGTGSTGTTNVVVETTDVTGPDTTITTDGTTPSTNGPSTTDNTCTTGDSSSTTGTSDSTPGTTQTTGGTTPTSGPGTTNPAPTTTTNQQQYTAAQREKSAQAAALDLTDAVVRYFLNDGDISGVRHLVASTASAQSSLTQMISSLNEPYGYRIVSTKSLTGSTVRVTVEFNDRVTDGQGNAKETTPRFAVIVLVDDDGATITAIYAGS